MRDDTVSLAEALRAIPTPAVRQGGWQRMQTALQQQARRRARTRTGWRWAAAIAAGLAVALVIPDWTVSPPGIPPDPAAGMPAIEALQAESAWLEALLASGSAGAVAADSTALRLHLGDRIAWVDTLLAAPVSAETAQALWGERVLLLRDLVALDSTDPWLMVAAQGDAHALSF